MSYDNQDNIVQESSSHKCGQEVRWDTLNGVAATIHSVMSGLPSTLKLFLYSVTSSGNVLLTMAMSRPSGPTVQGYGLLGTALAFSALVQHVAILPYSIYVAHNYN